MRACPEHKEPFCRSTGCPAPAFEEEDFELELGALEEEELTYETEPWEGVEIEEAEMMELRAIQPQAEPKGPSLEELVSAELELDAELLESESGLELGELVEGDVEEGLCSE
jgi:hypothetical protein